MVLNNVTTSLARTMSTAQYWNARREWWGTCGKIVIERRPRSAAEVLDRTAVLSVVGFGMTAYMWWWYDEGRYLLLMLNSVMMWIFNTLTDEVVKQRFEKKLKRSNLEMINSQEVRQQWRFNRLTRVQQHFGRHLRAKVRKWSVSRDADTADTPSLLSAFSPGQRYGGRGGERARIAKMEEGLSKRRRPRPL